MLGRHRAEGQRQQVAGLAVGGARGFRVAVDALCGIEEDGVHRLLERRGLCAQRLRGRDPLDVLVAGELADVGEGAQGPGHEQGGAEPLVLRGRAGAARGEVVAQHPRDQPLRITPAELVGEIPGRGRAVLGHQLHLAVLGDQLVQQLRQQAGPFRGGGELLVAPVRVRGDHRERAVLPLPVHLIGQPLAQHPAHVEARGHRRQRRERITGPAVLLLDGGVGGDVVHVVQQRGAHRLVELAQIRLRGGQGADLAQVRVGQDPGHGEPGEVAGDRLELDVAESLVAVTGREGAREGRLQQHPILLEAIGVDVLVRIVHRAVGPQLLRVPGHELDRRSRGAHPVGERVVAPAGDHPAHVQHDPLRGGGEHDGGDLLLLHHGLLHLPHQQRLRRPLRAMGADVIPRHQHRLPGAVVIAGQEPGAGILGGGEGLTLVHRVEGHRARSRAPVLPGGQRGDRAVGQLEPQVRPGAHRSAPRRPMPAPLVRRGHRMEASPQLDGQHVASLHQQRRGLDLDHLDAPARIRQAGIEPSPVHLGAVDVRAEGAQPRHPQPCREGRGGQLEGESQQRVLRVLAGGGDPAGQGGIDVAHAVAPGPSVIVDGSGQSGTMCAGSRRGALPGGGGARMGP